MTTEVRKYTSIDGIGSMDLWHNDENGTMTFHFRGDIGGDTVNVIVPCHVGREAIQRYIENDLKQAEHERKKVEKKAPIKLNTRGKPYKRGPHAVKAVKV